MGWTIYSDCTRAEMIAKVTATFQENGKRYTTLKKLTKGNTLYTVRTLELYNVVSNSWNEEHRWIEMFLLAKHGKDYGYKDMDESCGPNVYECPLEYFELVDDPGGYATDWREACRKYHAKNSVKPNLEKGITIEFDQEIKFVDGRSFKKFLVEKYGKAWRFIPIVQSKDKEIPSQYLIYRLHKHTLANSSFHKV